MLLSTRERSFRRLPTTDVKALLARVCVAGDYGSNPQPVAHRTNRHGTETYDAKAVGLTRRQLDTLRLLLFGASEKQVARSLKLSRHTVHVYVKAIYRSVRVSSRSELMAKFLRAALDASPPLGDPSER